MKSGQRNSWNVDKGDPVSFEKADAIRALRNVVASYTNPPAFNVGDLVQARNHFNGWEGAATRDPAPLAVLAVCDDLSERNEDLQAMGVPGIRLAHVYPDESVQLVWHEAWHFELYAGALPDAH